MNITNDAEKMEIVERLVKDGAIDFSEAIKLLQESEPILYYPWWQQPVYKTYDTITIPGISGNSICHFDVSALSQ